MTRPQRPQLPPDWAADLLFELEDPLPGCFYQRVASPGEVTAKQPARAGRAKHKQQPSHGH